MATKGQAALEFMFFTVLIIILLTASFSFSAGTNADTTNLKRRFEAANVCQHFATLIASVATSGNGTVVEYFLPRYVGGANYSISVEGAIVAVTVDYVKGSQTCRLPTANFTSVTITNKTGFIKNLGTGVLIE